VLGLGLGLVSVVQSFRRPVVVWLIQDGDNTVGFTYNYCIQSTCTLTLIYPLIVARS